MFWEIFWPCFAAMWTMTSIMSFVMQIQHIKNFTGSDPLFKKVIRPAYDRVMLISLGGPITLALCLADDKT